MDDGMEERVRDIVCCYMLQDVGMVDSDIFVLDLSVEINSIPAFLVTW
jgi:hypothetical protein